MCMRQLEHLSAYDAYAMSRERLGRVCGLVRALSQRMRYLTSRMWLRIWYVEVYPLVAVSLIACSADA